MFFETDNYAEMSSPAALTLTGIGVKTLVIDVGERCRLDYVSPTTVVAVKDGTQLPL